MDLISCVLGEVGTLEMVKLEATTALIGNLRSTLFSSKRTAALRQLNDIK